MIIRTTCRTTLELKNEPILLTSLKRLNACGEEDYKYLKLHGRLVHFEKENYIFRQNQPTELFYILVKGYIKIQRMTKENQSLLSILGPGDSIGEISLLTNQVFFANAIALTEVTIFSVPFYHYNNLKSFSKTFSDSTIKLVSFQAILLLEKYSDFIDGDVEKRLKTFITNQFKMYSHILTPTQLIIPFYLSRSDFAAAIHARSETVSRILSKWEKNGDLVTSESCLVGKMNVFS